MNFNELLKTSNFKGHVLIKDRDSGEVLVDNYNAIHPQNMATAIARSLAHSQNGTIFKLALGNGGTFFTSTGDLVYRSPNVIGNSDLYNLTYEEQVDSSVTGTPPNNSVTSTTSVTPSNSAIVVVTMELDSTEPIGQNQSDNIASNLNGLYAFDELGLKTQDGLLLSHIVFSTIEKTMNRSFIIIYTITISVS